MARMMSAYSRLVDLRVDGIDTIVVRYKNLVENAKKKSYDVLDHRKQEVCKGIQLGSNIPDHRKLEVC